jgi:hypothetical protein
VQATQELEMIENVILVGGPFDGQKRACAGGNVLSLFDERGIVQLNYRRAHADSKFFRFSGQSA